MKRKEGVLYLPTPSSRWLIVYSVGATMADSDWDTLTSGSVFEVKIGKRWVRTRVEHGPRGYYACVPGVRLENHLKARLP